jgi:hypothetical protein
MEARSKELRESMKGLQEQMQELELKFRPNQATIQAIQEKMQQKAEEIEKRVQQKLEQHLDQASEP